jgi:formamidopyrimidine-DNA glycosylase
MLEIPEAVTIARQIEDTLLGRTVVGVQAAFSPHKFAWYYEDPAEYPASLIGRTVSATAAPGGKVEVSAGDATMLFGDGVALRYWRPEAALPAKLQLLVQFDDGSAMTVSVQMYGGLWCFPRGQLDNYYYDVAKSKPSPLSEAFDEAYFAIIIDDPAVQKLSAKALLATEQRIPGLGNGALQDILFFAGVHPRRKVADLSPPERAGLFASLKCTLADMVAAGGRDTEKDLFGNPGGYLTILSSKTHGQPCPRCGSLIVKAAYMGGSIYFCPDCQPL